MGRRWRYALPPWSTQLSLRSTFELTEGLAWEAAD